MLRRTSGHVIADRAYSLRRPSALSQNHWFALGLDALSVAAWIWVLSGGLSTSVLASYLLIATAWVSLASTWQDSKTTRIPLRLFAWWLSFFLARANLFATSGWLWVALLPLERIPLKAFRKRVEAMEKLEKLDLRAGEFAGFRFTDLSFVEVDFRLADLRNTVFCRVTFSKCNLEEAFFSGATFEHCRFELCRLDLADLSGTRWEDTQVKGTSMTYANLEGAHFEPGCLVSRVDYDAANLTACNIQEVNLKLENWKQPS